MIKSAKSVALSALILIAFCLHAPSYADDGDDMDGCCVCNCTTEQATSTAQSAPAGALCVAGAANECSDTCGNRGCEVFFHSESECIAVAGCSDAAPTMAPIASTGALVALGLALAGFGIYTTRRT